MDDEQQPTRARTRRVSALVCLGAGALGVAGSLALDTGTLADPGPGLWPLTVSGLTLLGGLGLLRPPAAPDDSEPFSRSSGAVVAAVAAMAGYALLFPLVGFTLPAFGLLLFWIRVLGREPWIPALTVSAAASTGFFCLFALLLDVPLPRDLIWGV